MPTQQLSLISVAGDRWGTFGASAIEPLRIYTYACALGWRQWNNDHYQKRQPFHTACYIAKREQLQPSPSHLYE